jgi:hypothetical protein
VGPKEIMCFFSRMNELLGKPREGFHAERMTGDCARNDVVGTVVEPGLVVAHWDVPLWK